jgi:hypothetical protein
VFGRLIFLPSIFLPRECCSRKFAWLVAGADGQKDLGQKKLGWVWSSDFFALNFFATRMLFRSGSVVGLGSRGAKRAGAKKVGWVWASDFLALNFSAARMLLRSGSVVVLGNRGAKTSGAKKGGMGWGF